MVQTIYDIIKALGEELKVETKEGEGLGVYYRVDGAKKSEFVIQAKYDESTFIHFSIPSVFVQ